MAENITQTKIEIIPEFLKPHQLTVVTTTGLLDAPTWLDSNRAIAAQQANSEGVQQPTEDSRIVAAAILNKSNDGERVDGE